MRPRPTITAAVPVLLALGLCLPTWQCLAQGTQRSARPASSSETNSLEIFKSLNRLDVKQDEAKELDEELSKSLQPFANRHDLDVALPSTYVAPRIPVVKSRRSKDELEKSKGWIWDAEEAVSGSLKVDGDSLNGLDSEKKRSSWSDYAEQTRSERKDKSDFGSSSESKERNDANSQEDDSLPSGIREVAKGLRSRVQRESVGSVFSSPSFGGGVDFFGQALNNGTTPQQVEAQKAYMESFQKILGGPMIDNPMNSVASGGFFGATAGSGPLPGMSGLDTLPGSSVHSSGLAATPNLTPTVMAPATIPDINSTVLNGWNPLYTPPKIELPKPAPFFSPPLEVPRRKF